MDYYGDYDYFFAILGGISIVVGLLVLVILIVGIVANWKLFKKAGKKGWECIVPFYSSWILVEISGLNWWWFLLLILNFTLSFEIEGLTLALDICSFIASFNCYYNIAKKFGKDKTTSILAGIFPFIFILIFAFSKNEIYDKNINVTTNGIFGGEINNNDTNFQNTSNSANMNMEQSTETVDINNKNANKKVSKNSFCGNCGVKLGNDVRFCHNCGKEIK